MVDVVGACWADTVQTNTIFSTCADKDLQRHWYARFAYNHLQVKKKKNKKTQGDITINRFYFKYKQAKK